MSLAVVIDGVMPSATVWVLMAVGVLPTSKVWSAAEDKVGATMVMVLSSVAAVLPPEPETTNSRLSAAEMAVKLMKLKAATVMVSLAIKLVVTFKTKVLPASS